MSLLCRMANRLWLMSSRPEAERYRNALQAPRKAQEQVLFEILRRNKTSAFGQRHGYKNILGVDDFRSAVSISTYEDFTGWIEQMKNGVDGLLVHEKVNSIVPTGGSTGGTKYIPHPPSLLHAFRRGIAPWIVDLHQQYPSLKNGSAYWAITPSVQINDYADDTAYLGGMIARIVACTLAVPPPVVPKHTGDAFWTTTLRYLLARNDLAFISVWHPSFLCILLDRMEEQWDELIPLLPEPRVCTLRHEDPRNVSAIWPKLRVVSCWGDAHAARACEMLRSRLGGVVIQPKGLIATEAFISLPYANKHPLAIRSHFFEFLDKQGRSHLASELDLHEVYRVVVTTSGGLYRYQLQDDITVDGFVDATPSIRFIGKVDNTCDLVGEKLTEVFVTACLARVFEKRNVCPAFSMMAPDESRLGYILYLEAENAAKDLANDLHQALMDNPQYAYASAMGQLAPVKLFRISADGYTLYAERLVRKGQRLGDIKAVSLRKETGWTHWFKRKSLTMSGS